MHSIQDIVSDVVFQLLNSSMSHSTTKTSSYTISKYSRAYPVKRTIAKSQLLSDASPETMQEWQHFTNPTLRLLLDMKISQNKELESVRLRIIWSINPTVDAEVGQQDVVFASFSSLMWPSIPADNMLIVKMHGRKIWISCRSRLSQLLLPENIKLKVCL
jgi:hypothetical protein